MVSKGKVLEAIKTHRMKLGEERVRRMPISDEWGHARTLLMLLLQNPDDDWYQSGLDDEAIRTQMMCILSELNGDFLEQGLLTQ